MAAREDRTDRPQSGRDNGPQDDDQPGDGGPNEAARFVSETTAELAQLSRRHGLDMLAHLLEMARLEADDIARRSASRGS